MTSRPRIDSLVMIQWLDIVVDHGWAEPRKPLEPATCRTVGFVQHVSDTCITIASTLGADKSSGRETNLRAVIPLGCITSWAYMMRAPTGEK